VFELVFRGLLGYGAGPTGNLEKKPSIRWRTEPCLGVKVRLESVRTSSGEPSSGFFRISAERLSRINLIAVPRRVSSIEELSNSTNSRRDGDLARALDLAGKTDPIPANRMSVTMSLFTNDHAQKWREHRVRASNRAPWLRWWFGFSSLTRRSPPAAPLFDVWQKLFRPRFTGDAQNIGNLLFKIGVAGSQDSSAPCAA